MWKSLGHFVLRFRILLLTFLFLTTAVMAWYASKVQLSYDFIRAIPADDPQYQEYLAFKKQYGEDGNLLVVGIQSDKLFQKDLFNAYSDMHQQMKTSFGVEDVLSICSAIDLTKDSQTLKNTLIAEPLQIRHHADTRPWESTRLRACLIRLRRTSDRLGDPVRDHARQPLP